MTPLDGRFFIAGERRESSEKAAVENPATLEPVGEVFLASSADCRGAIEAAKKAYPLWRDIATEEKRRLFLKAKAVLLRRATEIARLLAVEKGTPVVESLTNEVFTIIETLDYYGRNQRKALAPKKVRAHIPLFAHKRNRYLFQPLGPSLVISPWNFPFMIPFLDVIMELTVGNTIVLRPSTSTPFAALAIGEIMTEAGVPAGVLNIVPYLGPVIVAAVVFVVGFVQFGTIGMAAAASGITVVVTSLEGYVVTPWLTSKAAEMNAVAIFVGLLFWGWIWGLAGLLLAVPLMLALKAVCDRVEELKPVGELLGE